MHVCTGGVCMYVCMYVHTYVCICICHKLHVAKDVHISHIIALISTEYVTTSKYHIELLVGWHIDKAPKVTHLHIVVGF